MPTPSISRVPGPGPSSGGSHWDLLFHELAGALARAESIGLDDTGFSCTPQGYSRAVLHQDDAAEIVAIRWPAGTLSALHGHRSSSALIRLISGSLVEDSFLSAGNNLLHQSATLKAGGTRFLPPGSFHRIVAVTESFGLHAYSPRLVEAATEPSPAEFSRILAAWQSSDAARAGAPAPDYLAGSINKRSTP
jgi:hypothetical protein